MCMINRVFLYDASEDISPFCLSVIIHLHVISALKVNRLILKYNKSIFKLIIKLISKRLI